MYSTTCPNRPFCELKTCGNLQVCLLWINGSATATDGRPCSAVHNQNGSSVLTSLTSAIASTPENGIFRTAHYAGSMRKERSIETSLVGIIRTLAESDREL